MTHFLKALFVGLFVVIGISACSSTKEATSKVKTDGPVSDTPTWFVSSGFSSDSLSFHGFANAIEADSVIAVANALLQAKAQLETALANELEDIRKDMEAEGNQVVSKSDFIISLRNAHQSIQNAAKSSNGKAVEKDGHYFGYARVSISKSELETLISSGLSSNYQSLFVESEGFQTLIK